jgi:glycerol-3-phosphate O-acyltransferase
LLVAVPYSDRVTVTELTPAQIIAYGEEVKTLVRTRHPLGDVLGFDGENAVLQSYFRNNVLHLFACAAWVACCFQTNRRMSRAGVVRLGRLVYPFLQQELFLPWSEDEFGEQLQATVAVLMERGLFAFDPESGYLQRGMGQTDEVFQLRVIAHSLLHSFERYYIAISVLVKNGSGAISAGELENLCHLTAQRLSLLYSQAAPEFFDRSLFRGFIQKLRELKLVWICRREQQARLRRPPEGLGEGRARSCWAATCATPSNGSARTAGAPPARSRPLPEPTATPPADPGATRRMKDRRGRSLACPGSNPGPGQIVPQHTRAPFSRIAQLCLSPLLTCT